MLKEPHISCSIVIPVFNSESTLPILIKRLANVLPQITNDYEVILINDGSKDKSWEIIVRLKSQYPFIVGINFSKNFGQHNAILCGIRAARKELVVTMDDDLQHPPEEIHKLIYKLIEGYDVVYGMPRKGPHTIWRNLASRVTKRTLAFVMGMKNVEEISSFRVFRSKFKLAFDRYDDPGVIVDVLLSWGTSNFASIIVEENPRDIGVSNYTFTKLIHQTILILTGFSTVPLRLASWMGFLFTLFGIAIFLFVLISYLSMGSIPGFPFLASIIAIFSGAQLFALGLIGEYLARISDRSMGRPAYIIESTTEDSSKNKFLSIEEPHH